MTPADTPAAVPAHQSSPYSEMPTARTPLRHRVMRAGAWSVAGYGVSLVIRFGTNLVMTRLLAPDMFGVMAIASMIMVGLGLFSDIGLRQNVIQSPRGSEPAYLNTVWSMQIIRGLLLWAVAAVISAAILLAQRTGFMLAGSVYGTPSLPLVVTAISATALISGFDSTKLLEASRGLSLSKITQLDLMAQVGGLAVMLGWLIWDRSIWVLVAGSLGSTLTRTALSHWWLAGMPNQWHWERRAVHEIFHFGKWLFVSSVLGFFVNNGDRLLLGASVTASELGVYVIAFLIYSSAEQIIGKIIIDVIFPALSEVARERRHDLRTSYYKFHTLVAGFSYACAGALFVAAPSLITFLYDARYAQAGWVLHVLALALLTVPFRVATECFLAMGMPQLLSTSIAIRLVALFAGFPVGVHFFGFSGGVWAIVLSNFSWVPLQLVYKILYKLFDLKKELVALSYVLIGALAGKVITMVLSG
jgi:O-antigen/teichoic acid export membrane protein